MGGHIAGDIMWGIMGDMGGHHLGTLWGETLWGALWRHHGETLCGHVVEGHHGGTS